MASGELSYCQSKDGTRVAVARLGSGPPLVAVHGGTADRSRWAPVADALASRFTLHLIDRRGRGDSQQEADGPYSLGLEVEDLLAVLADVGRPVALLGHSYGGLISLETLPRTDLVAGALLYEPAFGPGIVPPGVLARLEDLVAQGQREPALETFYREVVGIDPTPMKSLPIWQARIAAVHTIVREGTAGIGYQPDAGNFAGVDVPTRVLLGSESPMPFRLAATSAVDVVPGAELVELPGQGHVMIDADSTGFVERVFQFFDTVDL